MTWDTLTLVLAQDAPADRPVAPDNIDAVAIESQQNSSTPLAGDAPDATSRSGSSMLIWLLPLALVFFMLSMGGRKEKKKHAKLMAALSKGDKVKTVGGILGTIVEVRDDEVVVKVDENANTRLHFARSAIQAILESKNAD